MPAILLTLSILAVEGAIGKRSSAAAMPAAPMAPTIGGITTSVPAAGVPTTLTAQIGGVTTEPVVLDVIVGFAAATAIPLHDDGLDGDPLAGDGSYTATIPAQPAGTLVRHRVRVGSGATEQVFPVKDGKRRYDGFVVARAAIASNLPVLDWYLSAADATWLANNRGSKDYVPAVLVVDGRVIDGAEVRNQGGFTAGFSPKPNFKFKLPGQQVLEAPFFDQPVDEFVADADYEDPTSAIGRSAWQLFGAVDVHRQTSTARVERNGAFWGVYQLYQELDGTWFDQQAYEIASFYEGESGAAALVDEGDPGLLAARWEQTVGDTAGADLAELVSAVDGSAGPARIDAIADRFDVPRLVDLLAMSALTQHFDSGQTNMDLARGTDGRWRIIPNDLDLTLGLRNRTRLGTLVSSLLSGTTTELRADGALAEQVARRTRSLFDEWFADDRILEDAQARVDAMAPDLVLDRAKWALATPTAAVGLTDLADFLAYQRSVMASWTSKGLMPTSPLSTAIRISEVSAHGTDADFVELANVDPERSADLSGWTIEGAAAVTLPGGTVLAPGARLVVPRSPAAMAALGRGVPVSGRLGAALPAGGGSLTVRDSAGDARDQVTWSTASGWPAPGASGRSLEAKVLDGGRATASGWALSPTAGGTPGDAGGSARGLSVRVVAGMPVGLRTATSLRIVVANAGPGPRTNVVLDGPTDGCDRSLGQIPAGASVVVDCVGPTSAGRDVVSLRATVRSTEEPSGATDAPVLTLMEPESLPAGASIRQLRLGTGTLVASHTAPPTEPKTWRVSSQFAPIAGGETVDRVIAPTSPGQYDVGVGRAGRVRLIVRGTNGATSASAWSPTITARATERWPFATDAALIDRWYLDLGGRPATAPDQAVWTAAFAGDGDPAALALGLLAGDRWTKAVDPLVRTYLAHFGRLPDPSGLRYWAGKRRAGVTLARINAQFAGSSEFRRRYEGLDTSEVVTAVYRNVFGRDPDPSGQDYWARRIDGGYPVGSMVLSFSESSEGVRRKAPTVVALVTWFAFHDGVPTAAWMDEALAWLAAGGDRGTLVESARSATAYGTRVS